MATTPASLENTLEETVKISATMETGSLPSARRNLEAVFFDLDDPLVLIHAAYTIAHKAVQVCMYCKFQYSEALKSFGLHPQDSPEFFFLSIPTTEECFCWLVPSSFFQMLGFLNSLLQWMGCSRAFHLPSPCSACFMVNAWNEEHEMVIRNNRYRIPKVPVNPNCVGFWASSVNEILRVWQAKICWGHGQARGGLVQARAWDSAPHINLIDVCKSLIETELRERRGCYCASFGTVEDSTSDEMLLLIYCNVWCATMGSHTPRWLLIFVIPICLCNFL